MAWSPDERESFEVIASGYENQIFHDLATTSDICPSVDDEVKRSILAENTRFEVATLPPGAHLFAHFVAGGMVTLRVQPLEPGQFEVPRDDDLVLEVVQDTYGLQHINRGQYMRFYGAAIEDTQAGIEEGFFVHRAGFAYSQLDSEQGADAFCTPPVQRLYVLRGAEYDYENAFKPQDAQ